MGVCLGMTGDGASKKSRSGSSKTESTARIATAAPPNPPLELFEEDDDDLLLKLTLHSNALDKRVLLHRVDAG
jgi:hypothetical protein